MYKIKDVAKIANISTRTLRYYDEINLLNPSYVNQSGYRIYTENEIDTLQQILFYRRLNLPLNDIKSLIYDDGFDFISSLLMHKENLLKQRQTIDILLNTIEKTIANQKGEMEMSTEDKFEGLKEEIIKEVDKKYGKELRDSYGKNAIEEGFKKFKKLSKHDMDQADKLAHDILDSLKILLKESTPESDEAQELCKMHQTWIQYYWPTYNKEAHLGLTKMYTTDERFTAYYDKAGKGASQFLYEAMKIYLN